MIERVFNRQGKRTMAEKLSYDVCKPTFYPPFYNRIPARGLLLLLILALFLTPLGAALAPTEELPEPPFHSADQDKNYQVSLSELLRVIQFYNSDGICCAGEENSEDGFLPRLAGEEEKNCTPHKSDYNPQDWEITLTELLRLIQLYNSRGYFPEESGEDGFAPGLDALPIVDVLVIFFDDLDLDEDRGLSFDEAGAPGCRAETSLFRRPRYRRRWPRHPPSNCWRRPLRAREKGNPIPFPPRLPCSETTPFYMNAEPPYEDPRLHRHR